jgi:hypothetical protein
MAGKVWKRLVLFSTIFCGGCVQNTLKRLAVDAEFRLHCRSSATPTTLDRGQEDHAFDVLPFVVEVRKLAKKRSEEMESCLCGMFFAFWFSTFHFDSDPTDPGRV